MVLQAEQITEGAVGYASAFQKTGSVISDQHLIRDKKDGILESM